MRSGQFMQTLLGRKSPRGRPSYSNWGLAALHFRLRWNGGGDLFDPLDLAPVDLKHWIAQTASIYQPQAPVK
jgi:hypothetical protein